MKKLFPIIGVLFLMTGSLVFAFSEVAGFFQFDDVDSDNPDAWYADDVYSLHRRGVVNGYSDGTFRPENNVNRAELAAMLNRLIGSIENPNGKDEWQSYTNTEAGFTVEYPAGWRAVDNGEFGAGFGPLDQPEDVSWGISVYDSAEKTIDDLTAKIWDQFGERRGETREALILNGMEATKVTATTPTHPNFYARDIYIEKNGKIFAIGNGAIIDPDFEVFYRSFKLTK